MEKDEKCLSIYPGSSSVFLYTFLTILEMWIEKDEKRTEINALAFLLSKIFQDTISYASCDNFSQKLKLIKSL